MHKMINSGYSHISVAAVSIFSGMGFYSPPTQQAYTSYATKPVLSSQTTIRPIHNPMPEKIDTAAQCPPKSYTARLRQVSEARHRSVVQPQGEIQEEGRKKTLPAISHLRLEKMSKLCLSGKTLAVVKL